MSGTAHTPGPWAWFGNEHGLHLATTHSGRCYVMSFARKGMNGAQPRFPVNGRMVNASDLVTFEVGDRQARGFKNGKSNPTVYRYDVDGIDHPDARLIAAAPDLLAAIKTLIDQRDGRFSTESAWDAARAALSKATSRATAGAR